MDLWHMEGTQLSFLRFVILRYRIGFQNGADDYVVKPFELVVLWPRILFLAGPAMRWAVSFLRWDYHRPESQDSYFHLKDQFERGGIPLLLYLMQNKGKTVTREKILEQVWDVNGNYVNNNTLTVTMKRLRDKLDQPSCLKTVRSVGYRMEDTI
ncbi:MAG: winged-helix domain-containing protein [[Clostridium] scindens]